MRSASLLLTALSILLFGACAPPPADNSSLLCDDDLAGEWDAYLSDDTESVMTVTGDRDGFRFDVPGGFIDGTIAADNTITAVLHTDSDYPANDGSDYECASVDRESMFFSFTLGDDGTIEATLTPRP